jgi:hypothetical protein
MPDDKDCAGANLLRCLTKPCRDSLGGLLVALAVRKRIDEMPQPLRIDLRGWPSREIAIVAFTQPGIANDAKRAIGESDLGSAKGAGEVRADDGGDVIVTTPLAEYARLLLAGTGQGNVEPARGKTGFIVEAGRVRFEDQLQASCLYLMAAAPAFEMISSCAAVTPLVPTAPMNSVPLRIGTPPAKVMPFGTSVTVLALSCAP